MPDCSRHSVAESRCVRRVGSIRLRGLRRVVGLLTAGILLAALGTLGGPPGAGGSTRARALGTGLHKRAVFWGISCSSALACVGVGTEGLPDGGVPAGPQLIERWSGRRWSEQPAPRPLRSTTSVLVSVSCPTPTFCTAVGTSYEPTGAVPLIERFDGQLWQVAHRPVPSRSDDPKLVSVSCPTPTSCTAVGTSYHGSVGTPFVDRWDGARWGLRHLPLLPRATSSSLASVSCPTPTFCTAVGTSYEPTGAVPLIERFDKTGWHVAHSPALGGGPDASLAGVSCPTPTFCTAVGIVHDDAASSLLVEQWDGTRWYVARPPAPAGSLASSLAGVSCPTATFCTAVGATSGGGPGEPLIVSWNGKRWRDDQQLALAGSGEIASVSCPTPTFCTAVGSARTGMVTELPLAEQWDGRSWRVET